MKPGLINASPFVEIYRALLLTKRQLRAYFAAMVAGLLWKPPWVYSTYPRAQRLRGWQMQNFRGGKSKAESPGKLSEEVRCPYA